MIDPRESFKAPFKYDDAVGGYVFDANGSMVLQIRGWGRLQYLGEDKAIAIQVWLGERSVTC